MAHTIICPFYRVLGDMVEGDCKTTIEEAKADWYQEFRQYWSEEYDGGAGNEVPGMSDAKAQEDAQLVAGQTEAGINTATHEYFSEHPDGVCFGSDGWVFTLPWETKDAD